VHPTIAHRSGLDWRLLSMDQKTQGDIQVEVNPKFRCLKRITYVSLAKLQPSLSYEPHEHTDHEEIYYIFSGKGKIRIGNETARFKDGDVIYIPENKVHSIINDGDDMIEFLAFGGLIK
jgi:quercetin dioxygenase-like cupin family protein